MSNPRDKHFNAIENVRQFRYCNEEEIEKKLHLNDTFNVPDGDGRVLISKDFTNNIMY